MSLCKDKDFYATKSQAKKGRKRKESEYLRKLYIYECDICGYYHLSKHQHRLTRYRVNGSIYYSAMRERVRHAEIP